jgi:hypothetical protein
MSRKVGSRWLRPAISPLLLALVTCSLGAQPGSPTRKNMKIDVSPYRLPDSAFWQPDADRGLDPLPTKYGFTYFGVLIDAPRQVVLPTNDTLPLFAYYLGSYAQVATHDFPRGAFLAVVDPDRNTLRVAAFMEASGEDIPVLETTPVEDLPKGFLTTFQELDVRGRIGLAWQPGRVISEILLNDLTSNRVETKLSASANQFVDIEKEKFLAAERAKLNPPGPFPDLLPAKAEETPDALPFPETFGLALAAPRVTVINAKESIFLRGSWNLPVFPEELVKPENETYNKAHGLLKLDGFTPLVACITIHVLIVGSRSGTPIQYQFNLPVTKLATGPENPTSTGSFNIDLTKLRNFPLLDQTLFVHAYAKEWAAEPVMIGVVNRIPKE